MTTEKDVALSQPAPRYKKGEWVLFQEGGTTRWFMGEIVALIPITPKGVAYHIKPPYTKWAIELRWESEIMNTITNQQEYQVALKRMEEIYQAEEGTPEFDELTKLGKLIEDYENEHFPIDAPEDPNRHSNDKP